MTREFGTSTGDPSWNLGIKMSRHFTLKSSTTFGKRAGGQRKSISHHEKQAQSMIINVASAPTFPDYNTRRSREVSR